MRPVVRGNRPESDGVQIAFNEYAEARGELIARMGEFCSYCEMHLDASLAVEHVQPKKPAGSSVNIASRELDWNNFLLGCTNCNSTKRNIDVILGDYLWPDRDNTFRAMSYSEGGLVGVSEDLESEELKTKSKAIIDLVGLHKTPNAERASDRRWLNRKEAWEIAQRSKDRLSRNDNQDFRDQIVETAAANGFWSVWFTVFSDDFNMRQRLIQAFPGTSAECFNPPSFAPIQRNGGQC